MAVLPVSGLGEDILARTSPADVIDVLLVSVLIYAVLRLVRRGAARSMYVGASVLVVLYFAADAFDLFLTRMLFQWVLPVLLIALVVVFQEDFRRLFERVATGVMLPGSAASQPVPVDVLTEVVYGLASERVGALIVLAGRDPLDRHLDGGVSLKGVPSRLLLFSLFDPHSPGHDGAAIIEGGRVSRFAVHLPLAAHREGPILGTRHSSALGLSERSDAFVLVVSEERGEVSVAEFGQIETVDNSTTLADRLNRFEEDRFPSDQRQAWWQWCMSDMGLKLVSLFLAGAIWLSFAEPSEPLYRTFVVPIEYRNKPVDLELGDFTPSEGRMTLVGTEREFSLLDAGKLRISVDLAGLNAGPVEIPLGQSNLTHPPELEVDSFRPQVIQTRLSPARPKP